MRYDIYDLMLILCDQYLIDSHDYIVSPSHSFSGLIKCDRLPALQLLYLLP